MTSIQPELWVEEARAAIAFYEAAFQDLVDRGETIALHPIDDVDWIEIDSLDDLATANGLVCRC